MVLSLMNDPEMSEEILSPAERLKEFIRTTGMGTTQVADLLGVPRPTFSQLLTGRCKTINDQMLGRLDRTFPHLNLYWLLFGRGEMFNTPEATPWQDEEETDTGFEQTPEEAPAHQPAVEPAQRPAQTPAVEPLTQTPEESPARKPTDGVPSAPQPQPGQPCAPVRRAVKIVIFYDDGTFQDFEPSVKD